MSMKNVPVYSWADINAQKRMKEIDDSLKTCIREINENKSAIDENIQNLELPQCDMR